MKEKLLEIKDLVIKYVTDEEVVNAVNGIDLTIHKGEAMGLVGETGAGKTTTAMSILKLLPKYTGKIPQGSIMLGDTDIIHADDKKMRELRGNKVAMIFQDPMTSLNPVLTVGRQIAEVIELHNKDLKNEEVDAKVCEILEMVGIKSTRKNDFPHQFSGGMKQRVMIAIATACNPELLIADEPTTALDVTIQAQVINMMRNLREKQNSSVMLITHDLGIVANFCDSVAIMYAGEIVENGTLEDVFDRRRFHHPYTEGLFGSIPNLNVKTRRLEPIAGLMPDPTDLPAGCKFHPRCPKAQEQCKSGVIAVGKDGTHQIKCVLFDGQQ